MGLFGKKSSPPDHGYGAQPPADDGPDYSKLDSIRAEWPQARLDEAADLENWQRALRLYEQDDYPTMMQCATLFATALAHSLYGRDILKGDDLPETVHKTLYCALCAPPDGRTFAESAEKAARLALTVMRENGWQPPRFGGSQTFFEPLLSDKGNFMLLTAAISPPGRPWQGSLSAFFSVPPTPLVDESPEPAAGHTIETVDRVYATLKDSEEGDAASRFYMEGLSLTAAGDTEAALVKYTEAANLGFVDAMAEAGSLAGRLGRVQESQFWYESAANAGHPIGMFNTGIAAIERGDRATATTWFEKAAQAGNIEGYAALTQIARDIGDGAAEREWARLGAEAGHSFCMARHGLFLLMDADGDVPTLRRAREYLERAAERGNVDAMGMAVSVNAELGDRARGQRFVEMTVQSGDAAAVDRLRRHGFL